MPPVAKLVDKTLLKTFVPATALNSDNFTELAGKAAIEELPPNRVLFKAGDTDRKTIYVIEGEVVLMPANGGQPVLIRGGTPQAKHPIGQHQPRQHNAGTRTACKITRLDSDLMDMLLTWDQMTGIEVSDIKHTEDDGGDWMTSILQSQAFLQVPPANIQAMFMRMQEVEARVGDTIIKQGDDGDYYYIIKSGKAKVTRPGKTGTDLVLAQLKVGNAFGEEALVSDSKRNANVVMVTDGSLMRLSKTDFNALLKEPMLGTVSWTEAAEKAKAGAVLLDVRLESECANSGVKGSVNMPLFMLRIKADTLDGKREHLVFCDTGRRSSAAAFLLSERGIRAFVIKGGLQARQAAS